MRTAQLQNNSRKGISKARVLFGIISVGYVIFLCNVILLVPNLHEYIHPNTNPNPNTNNTCGKYCVSKGNNSHTMRDGSVTHGTEEWTEEDNFTILKRKFKFAENVSIALSVRADAQEVQGRLFAEHVLRTLENMRNGGNKHLSKCVYNDPMKKLITHEYTHRKRRKDEHTTIGMYHAVRNVVSDTRMNGSFAEGSLWRFSPGLPTVLNHYPIILGQEHKFNVSRPFGSWHTVLYPVNKLVTYYEKNLIPPNVNVPQIMEAIPPLFAAVFPNGLVKSGYGITCNGHVLSAGGCLWGGISVDPKEEEIHEKEIVIPFCDKWCSGYYHFTHEHLPRLALVHELLIHPDSPTVLVLPNRPSYFAKQFIFDILGVPRHKVVWEYSIYSGDLLVYPTPQRCGNTMTHLLYMIRRLVTKRLNLSIGAIPRNYSRIGAAKTPRFRILFAERSKLSRMPRNYYEIKWRLLRELGDRVVVVPNKGENSVVSQVRRFYEADLVIGPHGANLANMMWMRPRTHVIELISAIDANLCYYATAARINLVHHLLFHSGGKADQYTLEYDLLKKHVDNALEALESENYTFVGSVL